MRAKKRKNRIRKSTKYLVIVASMVSIVVSASNLFTNLSKENMKTSTKEIYNYNNKFNYDYKVNLIENKYVNNKQNLNKELVSVTELIDTINLKLNYEYEGSVESNIKGKYWIIGKTEGIYAKDGEEQKVIEQEEILFEEEEINIKDKKININKDLEIDLKDKNKLINEFKQTMGMSIDARYTVTLKIEIYTNIEGENVKNTYSPSVRMDLAEKTTKIYGEKDEKIQYVSKEYSVNSVGNKASIIIDIAVIAIALLIVKHVLQSKPTNIIKNEFRQQLNRILKIYQDKIIQVSQKPTEDVNNIVDVKDFGEIAKAAEELFKPILYYYDHEKDEAWFSIMSGNIVYRYILKGE